MIAKFMPYVKRAGIFTSNTRNRLLGMEGLPGRDKTGNDFWYDVR
jgi:hypothetical protein